MLPIAIFLTKARGLKRKPARVSNKKVLTVAIECQIIIFRESTKNPVGESLNFLNPFC